MKGCFQSIQWSNIILKHSCHLQKEREKKNWASITLLYIMMFSKGMRGCFGSVGQRNKQTGVSVFQLAEAPADNHGAGCWLPRKAKLTTTWNLPAGWACALIFPGKIQVFGPLKQVSLLLILYNCFTRSSKVRWMGPVHPKMWGKSTKGISAIFTSRERKPWHLFHRGYLNHQLLLYHHPTRSLQI